MNEAPGQKHKKINKNQFVINFLNKLEPFKTEYTKMKLCLLNRYFEF